MMKEAWSKPINLSDNTVPRLMPHIYQIMNNYGKNSFTWVGRIPRVHIMDPELIRSILKNYKNFQKNHHSYNPLTKFLLTGIGSLEGDKWAKHRKIITPSFQIENLKVMLPTFVACYDVLMSQWEEMVSKKGSFEVDVFPVLDATTSDVIARASFGSNYEEGKRVFVYLKELINLTYQIMQSVYIPGWSYLPTKRNKRVKEVNREINASLRDMINKRMKAMSLGEASRDDLLGRLLDSNMKEIQHGNDKDSGMSIEDVISECKLFYFAGQETTGILLTWTIILLGDHPEWQNRARKEVFQVFGNNKPNFDALNQLKIIPMILYEVLRLYPPVIELSKNSQEDIKLGQVSLPAGVQVMLPSLLLHRDPEFWGDDASEFNPERFSEGVSKATKSQFTYIPFSWGPRMCVGQQFALLQARMGLAMILQNFRFEISPSYKHAPYTVLTLQPQYGAQIILHKI